MLMGDFFKKCGSKFSITEEITSEPKPQVFHPPSNTIKRPVFFTEPIIDVKSSGLIILRSINSIFLFGNCFEKTSIASFANFVEYPDVTTVSMSL